MTDTTKIYLAGPMEKDHCDTTVLAEWREEIMRRAQIKRDWLYPEQIEEQFDEKHGYSMTNIPQACLQMVALSDAVLAFIDTPNRLGTFCELAVADILNKPTYIAAIAPNGIPNTPWFIKRLYNYQIEYLATAEECVAFLVNCVGGVKANIDYRAYIVSPEWRIKAEAAKERAGQRCQVCNKSREIVQLDAHHRTYERLGNELPDDITVLCHHCHGKFHGKVAA